MKGCSIASTVVMRSAGSYRSSLSRKSRDTSVMNLMWTAERWGGGMVGKVAPRSVLAPPVACGGGMRRRRWWCDRAISRGQPGEGHEAACMAWGDRKGARGGRTAAQLDACDTQTVFLAAPKERERASEGGGCEPLVLVVDVVRPLPLFAEAQDLVELPVELQVVLLHTHTSHIDIAHRKVAGEDVTQLARRTPHVACCTSHMAWHGTAAMRPNATTSRQSHTNATAATPRTHGWLC